MIFTTAEEKQIPKIQSQLISGQCGICKKTYTDCTCFDELLTKLRNQRNAQCVTAPIQKIDKPFSPRDTTVFEENFVSPCD